MSEKHIFLVGFMGVGKTTNGKKLAQAMNRPFVDLDDLFVEREHTPISDFFKEHGEEAFRLKERDILQQLQLPAPSVIATGGGAPCYFDNMDWMNAHGITVYLQIPAKALANRLAGSKRHKRPLIQDLSEEEILDFINERMQTRHPHYAKAQHHVNVLDLDVEHLIAQLFSTPKE